MLGQMAVDAEGNLAVGALEGSRIGGGWNAKRRRHHHLVLVCLRSFVLLQMTLCPEGDAARFALELTLHVMDVHVQGKLMLPLEGLGADGARGSRIAGNGSWRHSPAVGHMLEFTALAAGCGVLKAIFAHNHSTLRGLR
ncbi:hypothetical protein M5D96_007594 [Drosophila gunungcola]|uniref:Uncharacterized protein n=1 Tax=Drosophila gunungcola TaxID=103775 RepID=A0A9P9YND8_9MUSC|nr:hypothetical protein M5D96_007594 [Drosophila gunungcola]